MNLSYIMKVATKADSNVIGLGLLAPNAVIEENWKIVSRVDGLKFRIDTTNDIEPNIAVKNLLINLVVSEQADTTREQDYHKTSAISTFLGDTSIMARITRALAIVIKDEINLLRGSVVVGTATAVWDSPNIANGTGITSPNLTVVGAVIGDVVDVSSPVNTAGLIIYGYVSAPNTISLRLQNNTGSAINLVSGTWGVAVRRPRNLTPRTIEDLQNAITAKIQAG